MENESNVTTEEPVQAPLRCASCGGLNPPTASWCGQCLTRFDQPAATPPKAGEPPAPPDTTTEAPRADDPTRERRPPAAGLAAASDVPFQVTEDGITWACSVCGTVNDFELLDCEVCGAPFAKTVLPEEEKPQRDPNMAALASLLLPGAGHAYIGHWGQAIARGVISLWAIMVVFVAALQRGAASSNLVMVVFGIVATGLWGVGAHDAYREARGEKSLVILKGKAFFYLVLGLILLLIMLLMSAALKANGS
jgi:hypothetical protein